MRADRAGHRKRRSCQPTDLGDGFIRDLWSTWRALRGGTPFSANDGCAQHSGAVAGGRAPQLPSMLRAIDDSTQIVFVCNPNNPQVKAVRQEELTEFIGAGAI